MQIQSTLHRAAFAALAVLPLSSCFLSRSRANPVFAEGAVAQILPGTSTADDVTRLLGAPNQVVQLGRKSAWKFEHTVEKQAALFLVVLGLRGVDTQVDRVWVFFDEAGNVIHIGSIFQADEAAYDIPVF